MQLASGTHILDDLLAANALLSENSHQGFEAPTHTLDRGFSGAISHTSLEIITTLYDDDAGSRCTGKERDNESGLDYFGARYYASSMGRWMSPDPILITQQKMVGPQQRNIYSYVRNNPLRMVDKNGEWPIVVH
jgi:RHS repeat-associated protein